VNQTLHTIVGLRHGVRAERIRRFEKLAMDSGDQLGLRQNKDVVVAFEVVTPQPESLAAIIRFGWMPRLEHRAHRSIEDKDAFR
jgi:hypothetical protein